MFDSLAQKLSQAMKSLRGQSKITEANLEVVLREVRMALLEADVHVSVARTFLQRVKEKALGAEVMQGLNPAQAFIDIVHHELVEIMGGQASEHPITFASKPPTVVMMVGLQGAGKTTTCGKLAVFLKKLGRSPLLVPADVYRPAAIEQLHVVAKAAGVASFHTGEQDPVAICAAAVAEARLKGWDVVVLDTAGRLHLDETLMEELVRIKAATRPDEILFVADAMTGQDAVRSATAFHEKLGITGVVLTKTDGDTRRRGLQHQAGHRPAPEVRGRGREAGGLPALSSGSHGPAHPRNGGCAQPHRACQGQDRREGSRGYGQAHGQESVHP
jgi:signal recognition particle subunit SRP54